MIFVGMIDKASAFALRRATERDAAGCVAIYAPVVETTAISFEEIAPSVDEMASRISESGARWPWLVAERQGMILGYAYATEHRTRSAYRWSTDVSVYLHSEARGQGLGTALYRSLFQILESQGFHRAHAGIALPNAASVALHRSTGFEHVGVYREVGFKFGRWHDVSWWARELTSGSTSPAEPTPMNDLDSEALRRCGVQS